MIDFYTDETKWSLERGYFDSIVNFLTDYTFNCPVHNFAYYSSMTANSVSVYYISQPATKHFMRIVCNYDLNDFIWLGT